MQRRSILEVLAVSVLAFGCSDDGSGADGDMDEADSAGTNDAGTNDAGTNDSGDTGNPAEGWESAYVASSVALECDMTEDEMIAAGAPSLSFGDAAVYIGHESYPQNDDALFARFDGGVQTYCQYHEVDGPDGFGLGMTWDGGDTAYLAYTINGSGSGFAQAGGWLSDYAPGPIAGGGPAVAVLARVETGGGTLEAATLMIAVTADQKVDELLPAAAPTVLDSGAVELMGNALSPPIDADAASAMSCEAAGPFEVRYRFSADLGTLECVEAAGCSSQAPC